MPETRKVCYQTNRKNADMRGNLQQTVKPTKKSISAEEQVSCPMEEGQEAIDGLWNGNLNED